MILLSAIIFSLPFKFELSEIAMIGCFAGYILAVIIVCLSAMVWGSHDQIMWEEKPADQQNAEEAPNV
ncbi:hypothetical protein KKC32_01110 [Patescibacteria group bacterium]|nr:hypothetical protein [Patescibacteria group bacterium]